MTSHTRRRWPHPHFLSSPFSLVSIVLLLLSMMVSSCHAATTADEVIQVEVQDVRFDRLSNSPVVILQDAEKKKAMPIWVGVFEAQAIALELQGTPPPRPLTHDLMKNILEQVGVQFEKVVVRELKGSTYYAHIYLVSAGKPVAIDSRPSDAIALALRFHRRIFVSKELFDTALAPETPRGQPEPASAKISGVTVQNLTEELAAYFNLQAATGVLVADTGTESNRESLQRGDVILAVAGEAVRDIDDFRAKLKNAQGQAANLQVLRDGKEMQVQLTPTEE